MSLSDHVRVAARFQRAVRIDLDLHNPNALDGFACTGTFERTLGTVAEQWAETGHAAFTWTGPYGGGKSSLVLAFAALLGPRGRPRDQARKVLGDAVSHSVTKAFKPSSRGWRRCEGGCEPPLTRAGLRRARAEIARRRVDRHDLAVAQF